MDQFRHLGGALVLAALGNLVLGVATLVAGDGTLLFVVSQFAGAVLLAVIGLSVATGDNHRDWARTPLGSHGPELIAVVTGVVGVVLLATGVSKLLAVL
ncbi:hypothetical protein [Haloarchaeobius amylolyticus]|uniref:hypothetical protein n=1 Tax=Haloarchaeobius amylolyticus TaxID=1198296 RepID=UPI00226F3F84|nr:hypothetical protein [Haloarchaeobius amylolyticus]